MHKRDTLRNKMPLNHACFAHNLSTARSLSNWGCPFQFWQPTKICETNWIQLKDYIL